MIVESDEELRRSKCEGKQGFASAALALQVAKRRRGHGQTHRKRQAYPCEFCGLWHVGSPMKTRKRAR
jgi:hypothetical protein